MEVEDNDEGIDTSINAVAAKQSIPKKIRDAFKNI